MAKNEFSYRHNAELLQQMMQKADISSLKQLSRVSGVSELQLIRLQNGLMPKMQIETLLKLSKALQVPLNQLLSSFLPPSLQASDRQDDSSSATVESLKQEYQRLQQLLKTQKQSLEQEFHSSSIQELESWLLQWPTAAAAAQKNPQLPAVRLLPLVKPVEKLLKKWGVEAIASVGEEIAYDPQWHQLIEGTAEPGDLVKVRYIGYRQGDKLLYRAKVSPLSS